MTTRALSDLLPILEVVAIILACFYVAILATVVYYLTAGWLEKIAARLDRRRDRRLWKQHDELARRFRAELEQLDSVDLGEELRRGRAA